MKLEPKLYLAYGSNLNKKQMEKRCPDAKNIGDAKLEDYELEFRGKKDNAYVTIKKSMGKSIPVGIWEISENDEKALDEYEEYPELYDKEMIKVCMNGKDILAMCYTMNDEYGKTLPTENYKEAIRQGYKDFNFDIKEFNELVAINEKEVKGQNI